MASISSGFDNADHVKILGAIDQLRELGVGDDISLPQIVVVGNQSSGKSSVLEGLTGLSFPVASDLCTRFATQINLRRAPESNKHVRVSIIPGPSSNTDDSEKERLKEFDKSLDNETIRGDVLAKLLDEAAEHMGLPKAGDDVENIEKRFSDAIFKIELAGPAHNHLSVVDVPGLFHNPTKYQTNEDKGIVRDLIESYITDSRTIIMAVMDALSNLANQEVFRMARSADPQGARTVGIITKCDALQSGDEPVILQIAKNETENLNHGWFCVRNRTTTEIKEGVSMFQRHLNEKKFFTTSPWNQLPKDRVGISSLAKFLGQLLHAHIRQEFPGVLNELQGLLEKVGIEQKGLGPSRQKSSEQRQYLIRIAVDYSHFLSDSLRGEYDPFVAAKDPLKLRMHLRNLDDDFAETLKDKGHRRPFRVNFTRASLEAVSGSQPSEPLIEPSEPSKPSEPSEPSDSSDSSRPSGPSDILDWIRDSYLELRGAELPGAVNPAVLERLFRQQAEAWRHISRGYVQRVEFAVHNFHEALLKRLVLHDTVRDKIRLRLEPISLEASRMAKQNLELILKDELEGVLQTLDPLFIRNWTDYKTPSDKKYVDDQAATVRMIHATLKAYYEAALRRFRDYVPIQVTKRIFLGQDSLLNGFSPEYVGGLSDSELASLAAEDYAVSTARTNLSYKAARMEKAMEIARAVCY
ncbi:MAG: hypothetical protein M1825_003253 [Sarcosagium campestre]|nr:MAG: hypothetical protein M1825_003253 [Sarcosagium campestre]